MRPLACIIAAAYVLIAGVGVEAQTRVYLTPEQALDRAFRAPGANGAPDSVVTRHLRLEAATVDALADEFAMKILDRAYVFHEAWREGAVARRAVVINTLGQAQPITYMVTMLPNGIVERVDLMAYREARGSEIRREAFLRQFENKSAADPIRVNGDIMHITGATISSRSVANGVRLALRLQHILLSQTPDAVAGNNENAQ